MIASPYGNWFDEKPQYLVDGVMGEGMSGSPVCTERTTHFENVDGSAHIAGASSFLIGVHSGEYRQTRASRNSDLNINQVWYSELIEQILLIDGLCDYVDSVSFDVSSELFDNSVNEDNVAKAFSELTTWSLFDPECNRPDSPVNFLDEKINIEDLPSLINYLRGL